MSKRVWTAEPQILNDAYLEVLIPGADGAENRTIDADLGVRYGYDDGQLAALRVVVLLRDGEVEASEPEDFELVDGNAEFQLEFGIDGDGEDGDVTTVTISVEASVDGGLLSVTIGGDLVKENSYTIDVEGPEDAVEDPTIGEVFYLIEGLDSAADVTPKRVYDVVFRGGYDGNVLTALLVSAGAAASFSDFNPEEDDASLWTEVAFDEEAGTTEPVELDAPYELAQEDGDPIVGSDKVTLTITGAEKDDDGNVIKLSITLAGPNDTTVETTAEVDIPDDVRKPQASDPSPDGGDDGDAETPATAEAQS